MKEYIVRVYAANENRGRTEWRNKEGQPHRDDGPAIEYTNKSSRGWYRNGQLHRDDGPAVEQVNGYKAWYRNGMLHRDDGPAIECSNGNKRWYRNGVELTEAAFLASFADPCANKLVEIEGKQYKLVPVSK